MIEFFKMRDVKSPERDEKMNVGIDLFIPEKSAFTEEELNKMCMNGENAEINGDEITVYPYKDIIVPGGVYCKFSPNVEMKISNKSGIATKSKFIHGAEVIDHSYEGEWMYHMINFSDKPRTLRFGQKLIQVVPHFVDMSKVVISTASTKEEFFADHYSTRGEAWAGSTGV